MKVRRYKCIIRPYLKEETFHQIALYEWKEKEDYEIVSPPYQKYIKGASDTNNSKEYVTEIYLLVIKREKK